MTSVVSVIVPTYRRDDLLDRCLAALAAQQFDPSAYEVIVCDDAASETTRCLVASWDARACTPIHYLPVRGTQGPAAARNRGWRAARGAIIAFTDDDCIPDPGWLRAGVRAFDETASTQYWQCGSPCAARLELSSARHMPFNPMNNVRSQHPRCAEGQVIGVCGRIVVPLPPAPTDYERDTAGLEIAEFATANCFYRREALEAVGGFDERFTAAWREDADLFFTLLECGYRTARAPEAVVVHPVRLAPWGVSLRQQRKSMFNALLYKKHPALYRQRIQRTPPLHYYGIVSALFTMLVGTASERRRAALIGGSLWLLLAGRFCARRLRGTAHTPRHVAEMVVTSIAIPPLSVYWRLRGAVRFRVPFL
jgi:cellulose synthase/poly-beta-1,6-N-acetylglucosamine synthase-like glycosyltransferase